MRESSTAKGSRNVRSASRFTAMARAQASRTRARSLSRSVGVTNENDDHPPGLPKCIPKDAAEAFFAAPPAVQRQMLLDADQPSRVYLGHKPILRSEIKFRSEGTVCFCKDMRYCPLVAMTRPTADPRFDGVSYQFYPTDQGWWKMRDTVLKLGKLSGRDRDEHDIAL
eukprot:Gregarina_sp_Poly_1__8562@NODE_507_length_7855_cov_144_722779_g405_i0_p5_GENE_NODE_507_length_7855_cov_144_722779_g405_i0NODE_507_length_7855_cov_144_722779_g405_i0_p5_ORF_typecomplete_len168_score22_69PPDFL/PF15060_6/0_044_NODE_507_length_7855_cov_144_722779_g405_i0112615